MFERPRAGFTRGGAQSPQGLKLASGEEGQDLNPRVHNRKARRFGGNGLISRFAPVVVTIVVCVGASVWLPQQPGFGPVDVLTGHSSTNGHAVQNGACEEGACLQSISVVEKAEPLAVMTETENKQPVGGESLTALLLVSLFLTVLWRWFAGESDRRSSALAAAGLPAILHCHPRDSASALFSVFRL